MNTEVVISIIACIATVVSTILAVQQNRKVRILKKQKHRLSWDDMEIAINQLFKKIESAFHSEIVLCLSERGTAIVTMGFSMFGRNLPIYTGFWQDPQKDQINMENMGFKEFISRNRKFYIPSVIFEIKDKRILLMDDWCYTGQAMKQILEAMIHSGHLKENIRCAALVASPSAKASFTDQTFFFSHFEFPDNDFSFPWGKAS